jgi:hypothetical protein
MSYVDLHVKDGKVVATTTSDNDHIAELEAENQRYRRLIADMECHCLPHVDEYEEST